MGKTTTVRALFGLARRQDGEVRVLGRPVAGMAADRIARLGIALVPEGRQIFPNLTVGENLTAFAANRRGADGPWTLARVHELFPVLAERKSHMGNRLSGGEQLMLAIGRALITNPHLLILDEATEGLAPLVREQIWRALELLRREGQAILIIDKHVARLTELADRHHVLERGRIVWSGTSAQLGAEPGIVQRYVGVGG
jgi:branched-chain amino acid transport system ATP-binding protein